MMGLQLPLAPAATLSVGGFSFPPIPTEWGSIKKMHVSKPGAPLIFHIQEAHDQPEAHRNIFNIIDFLHSRLGTNLIMAEGASGELYTDSLEILSKNKNFETIAGFLLDNLLMDGVSLAATTDSNYSFFGLEDAEVYNQNRQAYFNARSFQADIMQFIIQKEQQLKKERKSRFSDKLNSLYDNERKFEAEKIDLITYIESVLADAESKSIASSSYRNLTLFRKIQQLQAFADKGKLDQELSSLGLTLGEAKQLGEQISEDDLANAPQLRSELELTQKLKQIQGQHLFEELERLVKNIKESYLDPEEDQLFFDQLETFRSIKNTLQLKATRKDLDLISPDSPLLESLSDNAVLAVHDFYQKARLRDSIMMNQFFKRVQVEQNKTPNDKLSCVLVTGGFHTEFVEQKLEEKGFSFITISPRISQISENRFYSKRLNDDWTITEQAALSAPRTLSSPKALRSIQEFVLLNSKGLQFQQAWRQAQTKAASLGKPLGGKLKSAAKKGELEAIHYLPIEELGIQSRFSNKIKEAGFPLIGQMIQGIMFGNILVPNIPYIKQNIKGVDNVGIVEIQKQFAAINRLLKASLQEEPSSEKTPVFVPESDPQVQEVEIKPSTPKETNKQHSVLVLPGNETKIIRWSEHERKPRTRPVSDHSVVRLFNMVSPPKDLPPLVFEELYRNTLQKLSPSRVEGLLLAKMTILKRAFMEKLQRDPSNEIELAYYKAQLENKTLPDFLLDETLRDLEYVVIDLESTGLNIRESRIIELTAIAYKGLQEVERVSLLIKPDGNFNMPFNIEEFTGITKKEILEKGIPAEKAFPDILEFLKRYKKSLLVMHNAPYDSLLIQREMDHFGLGPFRIQVVNQGTELPTPFSKIENPDDGLAKNKPRFFAYDTLSSSRSFYPGISHNLGALLATFGVQTRMHRSTPDAIATKIVFLNTVKVHKVIKASSLGQVKKILVVGLNTDTPFIVEKLGKLGQILGREFEIVTVTGNKKAVTAIKKANGSSAPFNLVISYFVTGTTGWWTKTNTTADALLSTLDNDEIKIPTIILTPESPKKTGLDIQAFQKKLAQIEESPSHHDHMHKHNLDSGRMKSILDDLEKIKKPKWGSNAQTKNPPKSDANSLGNASEKKPSYKILLVGVKQELREKVKRGLDRISSDLQIDFEIAEKGSAVYANKAMKSDSFDLVISLFHTGVSTGFLTSDTTVYDLATLFKRTIDSPPFFLVITDEDIRNPKNFRLLKDMERDNMLLGYGLVSSHGTSTWRKEFSKVIKKIEIEKEKSEGSSLGITLPWKLKDSGKVSQIFNRADQLQNKITFIISVETLRQMSPSELEELNYHLKQKKRDILILKETNDWSPLPELEGNARFGSKDHLNDYAHRLKRNTNTHAIHLLGQTEVSASTTEILSVEQSLYAPTAAIEFLFQGKRDLFGIWKKAKDRWILQLSDHLQQLFTQAFTQRQIAQAA